MPNFGARAGTVTIPLAPDFFNQDFGYGLWEGVVDPASPEGPRAIVMFVPAGSLSKVWELVKEGYSERVELLAGSASLVVHRGEGDTEEWITMPLTMDNPTADGVIIECGDQFCVVTDDEDAIVLSRPSIDFDISYERDVTTHPADELSRFIVAHVASQNS